MTEKPTFVLGLGAQKAGTSWLHGYLKQSQRANMGKLKEYHIWDALWIEEFKEGRVTEKRQKKGKGKKKHNLRFRLQKKPANYAAYFHRQVSQDRPITGDISPSYSGLTSEHLARIKTLMENAGFAVKVVFLMRDPVDRCWSENRMQMGRQQHRRGLTFTQAEADARFLKLYTAERTHLRTNYNKTVDSIERVFSPQDTYFGFYEDMFTPDRIRALSDFLGVGYDPAFAEVRLNVSKSLISLDDGLRDACRAYYDHVYDYCYTRFPQTRTLWQAR